MTRAPSIYVLMPQVPCVRGGTEILSEQLVKRLNTAGFHSDLVTLPYKWEPKEEILREAMAWRMFNLDCDMVIPMKFPAYFVNHKVKIPWLTHQFRQIYDLFETPFSGFSNNLSDGQLREHIIQFDQFCLSESRHIYAIASNTRRRLQRYNDLEAELLYPPTALEEKLETLSYDDFFLSVGRLEEVKRFDLLLRALAASTTRPRLKIVGTGSQRTALQDLCHQLDLNDKVTFLGAITDDELARLYNTCRAVHFAPLDEDFGLVALEAMLAGKPVITGDDSGGTLEMVTDGETGLVVEPSPQAHAAAIDALAADTEQARRLGTAGQRRTTSINWDAVVKTLTQWVPS